MVCSPFKEEVHVVLLGLSQFTKNIFNILTHVLYYVVVVKGLNYFKIKVVK